MQQTTISRRRFLQKSAQLTLASSVAGSLLAACGGSSTGSSSSGPVTLTFWHTYNTTDTESSTLLNKVIPAFHAQHPNITVKALDIPYNSMLQKLIASVAGGNGPDIIRCDIIWMPQLAKIGALVKTDDIMNQRKNEFYPGPVETCFYQGSYYGLPLDTNTRALIYNKGLFSKAGISQPPTTTDEFKAAANKISTLGTNIFGYSEGGLDCWNILPWVWCFGGAVTDSSYTKATGYINGPQSVSALSFLLELFNSRGLSPLIIGNGTVQPDDALGKNLAGMVLDGPWAVPVLQQTYSKLQFGLATLPAGPDGQSSSVIGGEDIAIMSSSKNIDAAKTFMQYMTSADAQRTMGTTGQMPVLKSLADDSSLPSYFQTFNQQLQTAKPRPVSPNYTKIDTVLTDAFNRIFRKLATPQAALDAAASQIDTLLQS